MRRIYLGAAIALLALSACRTELNPDDRSAISDAANTARVAKQQSAQAIYEATQARKSADAAARAAMEASEKADRIFKELQKK